MDYKAYPKLYPVWRMSIVVLVNHAWGNREGGNLWEDSFGQIREQFNFIFYLFQKNCLSDRSTSRSNFCQDDRSTVIKITQKIKIN